MRASLVVALVASSLAWTGTAAHAAGVDPMSASKIQFEQANTRFNRGRQLYNEKKYEAALTEFRASHDIVASPNARLYVARALRELGRLVEAYVEFGRTAIEGKELAAQDTRYVKASESAVAERKDIEPQLGFVAVTVEHAAPDTKLKIGGEDIKRAAWGEQAPVMPGSTEIVVETPGRKPVSKSVSLKPGEKSAVVLDAASEEIAAETPATPVKPVEPPSDRSKLRPYAYVAAGVGAAGLLTFAIAGAASSSTFNDLQTSCHGPCPPSRASDISSGKTQQTVANVGLAVGLVGLAAGATLFVLSLGGKKSDAPAATSTSLVVSPSFIGLRGSM